MDNQTHKLLEQSMKQQLYGRKKELGSVLDGLGLGLPPDRRTRLRDAKKLEIDGFSDHEIRLTIPGIGAIEDEWRKIQAEGEREARHFRARLQNREIDDKLQAINMKVAVMNPLIYNQHMQPNHRHRHIDIPHSDQANNVPQRSTLGRDGAILGEIANADATTDATRRPEDPNIGNPLRSRSIEPMRCRPLSEKRARQGFFEMEKEAWRQGDVRHGGFATEISASREFSESITQAEFERKSLTSVAGRWEACHFKRYSLYVRNVVARPPCLPRYDPASYFQEDVRYLDPIGLVVAGTEERRIPVPRKEVPARIKIKRDPNLSGFPNLRTNMPLSQRAMDYARPWEEQRFMPFVPGPERDPYSPSEVYLRRILEDEDDILQERRPRCHVSFGRYHKLYLDALAEEAASAQPSHRQVKNGNPAARKKVVAVKNDTSRMPSFGNAFEDEDNVPVLLNVPDDDDKDEDYVDGDKGKRAKRRSRGGRRTKTEMR